MSNIEIKTNNFPRVNERIRKSITIIIDAAFKSGLSKGAQLIKRNAIKVLKTKVRTDSAGAASHGRPVWSDTLEQGVRRTKVKHDGKQDTFWVMSTVNSAGKKDRLSGAFRLHIMDEGATQHPHHKSALRTQGFWDAGVRTAAVDFDRYIEESCRKAQTKIDQLTQ